MSFPYLDLYRLEDGQVVECRRLEGGAGMSMQLGPFPQLWSTPGPEGH